LRKEVKAVKAVTAQAYALLIEVALGLALLQMTTEIIGKLITQAAQAFLR
jgi:hypothetical protein